MALKTRSKDAGWNGKGPIDGPSLGMAIALGSIITFSIVMVAILAIVLL
ncbi:hypothetical protein ACHMW4_30175 [Mesorhizobium sp. UC22_110]